MTATVLLLLIAPFAGSFLGVLADRLPRGESPVHPRSHCRRCGTALTPRDLLPVLSFALTRGRCRHCGAAIPAWLLHVEIAAAGLAVLAVIAAPSPAGAWASALFLWLLLALAVTDLTRFRLPDPLTAALMVAGSWLALLPGGVGLRSAAAGAAAGVAAFWLLRRIYRRLRGREGLGPGDVKLIAGLGAFAGLRDLPLVILLAALAALAAGLTAAALGRPAGRSPLGQRALPFGAALCGAGAALWLARAAALPV